MSDSDLARAEQWLTAAHQVYKNGEEAITLASLRALCLTIRIAAPHAKYLKLGQSDQGDWADLDVVLDHNHEEIENEDDEFWDDLTQYVWNLDDRSAYVWASPLTVAEGGLDKRQGIQVTLDIDKCLELTQQPMLLPNQIEVWSLSVDDGNSRAPKVTVHASEEECWARFREEYDGSNEYADVPNAFLPDKVAETIEIDSHVVTVP